MSRAQEACSRCGTCCSRNPPGLHPQDHGLYVAGVLQKEHLLTLRAGELVWDNVQQRVQPLEQEMVRLQARPGSTACIFYQPLRRSCTIHGRHPLECRAQKCWDTREVYKAYQEPRLSRLDLVPADSALGQIIQEHETKCSYFQVRELARQILYAGDKGQEKELAEILRVDQAMRSYLQQKAGVGKFQLLFIFGRRLQDTLPGLGLEARQVADGFEFRPCRDQAP
ncbi:MAG: YkgJ family cysteine cluster protein [Desulfohalobiaceae bacterium]